jgi:2',3'-cyclic-nucleotide 2'-phosphodiesterase (5'-nucleotidase family)
MQCGDFLSPSILSGMDQGASMVATLNRLPVTHCCFGNHEADLQLEDIAMCDSRRARPHQCPSNQCVWSLELRQRTASHPTAARRPAQKSRRRASLSSRSLPTASPDPHSRASEFRAKWLNSNLPEFLPVYTSTARKLGGPLGFRPQMPPWDVVTVSGPKGSFRVGLLGLLTSERGIFRTDTMRGLRIQPVIPSAEKWAAQLRDQLGVSHVIALTHQSIAADEALSRSGCVDLILGGHEHEVMELRPEGGCPIIKSGSDAKVAAVVQLWLGANRAVDVQVTFEEVAKRSADPQLQGEVDSHHAVRNPPTLAWTIFAPAAARRPLGAGKAGLLFPASTCACVMALPPCGSCLGAGGPSVLRGTARSARPSPSPR